MARKFIPEPVEDEPVEVENRVFTDEEYIKGLLGSDETILSVARYGDVLNATVSDKDGTTSIRTYVRN